MNKSVEQPKRYLAASNAAYLGELELDSERGEVKGAQAAQAECVMCGGTGGWPGVTGHVHCKPCNGTGKAQA